MKVDRRSLLFAVLPALFISAQAARAQDASWDGTWTGALSGLAGKSAPISVTIAGGKVTTYTVRGAPFDIQYSNVTPTKVSFGDRDHYGVKLFRVSDTTATARTHGRMGYSHATLTRR